MTGENRKHVAILGEMSICPAGEIRILEQTIPRLNFREPQSQDTRSTDIISTNYVNQSKTKVCRKSQYSRFSALHDTVHLANILFLTRVTLIGTRS